MANELIDFTLVSIALLGIGIYGLAVKRNFIRMLFAIEIIKLINPKAMANVATIIREYLKKFR